MFLSRKKWLRPAFNKKAPVIPPQIKRIVCHKSVFPATLAGPEAAPALVTQLCRVPPESHLLNFGG
jgi:hypothetical protein